MAIDSKILHAERKLRHHEETRTLSAKDAQKKEDRLNALRKDLAAEERVAQAAQGN